MDANLIPKEFTPEGEVNDSVDIEENPHDSKKLHKSSTKSAKNKSGKSRTETQASDLDMSRRTLSRTESYVGPKRLRSFCICFDVRHGMNLIFLAMFWNLAYALWDVYNEPVRIWKGEDKYSFETIMILLALWIITVVLPRMYAFYYFIIWMLDSHE